MNLIDERANVRSIALPIATTPMRFRVDGSTVLPATAPESYSLNADHRSRTVVHSPLGNSKGARYEENWRRQFAAFKLSKSRPRNATSGSLRQVRTRTPPISVDGKHNSGVYLLDFESPFLASTLVEEVKFNAKKLRCVYSVVPG